MVQSSLKVLMDRRSKANGAEEVLEKAPRRRSGGPLQNDANAPVPQ
jgi:hypothetical protein